MIRPATAHDVEAIALLEAECFGAAAWSETLVREEVVGERHHVLVDEHLQAYGAISIAGDVADLDRIAVIPAARGQGLAREILGGLVDLARDLGADRMLLEVAADNAAALGLYESFGFDTISTRKAYYPNGGDALIMELSIKEWR